MTSFFEKVEAERKRQDFLDDHAHLISPWKFSKAERDLRDRVLLRLHAPKPAPDK